MIASVTGTIQSIGTSSVTVAVGGIGILVHTTPHACHDLVIGESASFITYLAVREDALDLYGFIEPRDREMFLLLLTLPGVGPKTALDLLGRATVDTIIEAVSDENPDHLTRMANIGKKTAEKLVLGLKDKIAGIAATRPTPRQKTDADVVEAIMALGYSAHEARTAARSIPPELTDVGDRVKYALQQFSSR